MSLYKDEFDSFEQLEEELDLRARLQNAAHENGEAELSIVRGERITIEMIEEEVQRASLLSFEQLLEEYKTCYVNVLPGLWRSIYAEELRYRREAGQLDWKQMLKLPIELLFG